MPSGKNGRRDAWPMTAHRDCGADLPCTPAISGMTCQGSRPRLSPSPGLPRPALPLRDSRSSPSLPRGFRYRDRTDCRHTGRWKLTDGLLSRSPFLRQRQPLRRDPAPATVASWAKKTSGERAPPSPCSSTPLPDSSVSPPQRGRYVPFPPLSCPQRHAPRPRHQCPTPELHHPQDRHDRRLFASALLRRGCPPFRRNMRPASSGRFAIKKGPRRGPA